MSEGAEGRKEGTGSRPGEVVRLCVVGGERLSAGEGGREKGRKDGCTFIIYLPVLYFARGEKNTVIIYESLCFRVAIYNAEILVV